MYFLYTSTYYCICNFIEWCTYLVWGGVVWLTGCPTPGALDVELNGRVPAAENSLYVQRHHQLV